MYRAPLSPDGGPVMAQPTFQKTDAGMQGLNTAMEKQIAAMTTASNNVRDTLSSVMSHYVAPSSKVYQSKVHEWDEEYGRVKGKAVELQALMQQSNKILDSGDESAGGQAQSWSPGSNTFYNALT